MPSVIGKLIEQPFSTVCLVLGVVLVAMPSVTISRDVWAVHTPTTYLPVAVGIGLLLVSVIAFGATFLKEDLSADAGIDLTCVKEEEGALWVTVNGCQVRVTEGRIEDQQTSQTLAVALPCNEYFDDECVYDTRSALGAFVNRKFEGQVAAFIALAADECQRRFGPGVDQRKTDEASCKSFGPGRCILLPNPLDRSLSVALISTTTQRASEGLSGRISYLFEGMRELFGRLADARLNEVVMPVLGAGHGGIYPPLAFVGLILAVAEAARYGQGAQRPKRVTIVVYKRDEASRALVDPIVVRRALGLIGS